MSDNKYPCTLHTWQPVLLPDGRTIILCGKCGEHALTLTADPLAGFLPPIPAPTPAPIWVVPYWQFYPPFYPVAPRVLCTDHITKIPVSGVVSGITSITTAMTEPPYPYQQEEMSLGVGYSLADTMSGTSAPGSGVRLS